MFVLQEVGILVEMGALQDLVCRVLLRPDLAPVLSRDSIWERGHASEARNEHISIYKLLVRASILEVDQKKLC